MSDPLHVSTDEMRQLGTSFSAHAYDLGRHLADFRRRTEIELPPGAPESVTTAYQELLEASELARYTVAKLQDRLEEIGAGIREAARNSDEAHEEFAAQIRGIDQ